MTKNQNYTGQQCNESDTSFKAKKPSDKPVKKYAMADEYNKWCERTTTGEGPK